ncbi:MAG: hypothetical protein K1X72_04450 [Pyrinomonadaceae bacterium]|nr:hypothetical protein [Pyrinomonadaceae bacterium]
MASKYELIYQTLVYVGAELVETITNVTDDLEANMEVNLWNVHGRGLIVVSNDHDDCGLYQFVGLNGDPVTKDLDFIEKFAAQNKEFQALKNSFEEATKHDRELVDWRSRNV